MEHGTTGDAETPETRRHGDTDEISVASGL